jgi:hypothetical protein
MFVIGGSRSRDIEVRNPERASGDTHYRGFFIKKAPSAYALIMEKLIIVFL